jgi:hypothetical protein
MEENINSLILPKKELQIKNLIENKFNINLYGPCGSGKSFLIKNLFQKHISNTVKTIYLRISDFSNMESIYEKIKKLLIKISTQNNDRKLQKEGKKKSSRKKSMTINKIQEETNYRINQILDKEVINLREIYSLFEELQAGNSSYEEYSNIYFIIDNIDSIDYFQDKKLKKQLLKIFTICETFNLGIIFISSFKLLSSELILDFNFFLNFVAVDLIDVNLKENLFQIVKEEVLNMNNDLLPFSDGKTFNDALNYCIKTFTNNFLSLNDFIYHVKSLMEFHFLDISNKKKNFTNSEFKSKLRDSITEGVLKIRIIKSSNNFLEEEFEEKYVPEAGSFFETTANTLNSYNSNKNEGLNFQKFPLESLKVENTLSQNQKLLLIASYLAKETTQFMDEKIFKNVRNVKNIKKRVQRRRTGGSLKKKDGSSFNIHRLIGIFSTMKQIISEPVSNKHQNQHKELKTRNEINLDFISDLQTLIELKLILVKSSNKNSNTYNFEASSLSQRMFANISLNYSKSLCEEFGVNIFDFIKEE